MGLAGLLGLIGLITLIGVCAISEMRVEEHSNISSPLQLSTVPTCLLKAKEPFN